MTLAELISDYRKSHNLSQRQMGTRCGLSTGYISLIEKEVNPQTGKPMVPTLTVLNKIAKGMGITIDELIATCDDMPVDMRENTALTKKDEHDIARNLEKIMAALEDSGDLMFDGDPMSDEARDSIRSALKLGLEAAKLKNKETYTPKKYRKD